MLTREEIISSFQKVDFPGKIIETEEAKNIIFYSQSTEPNSKKEKDNQKLSQSYVLPWKYIQKNYNDINNKNNTFSRGSNFVPKEQLVDIKIANFKFIYDKYSIPHETGMIYFKNSYGGMNGPFNLNQIQNMYKNKKIDSTFEFRTIDIFKFKDSEIFSFKSIKIINEKNWSDLIEDTPLLKYNELSNSMKEKKEELNYEIITPKEKIEDKKGDKKENKKEEEKKDSKIKEKVNEKKEEKIIENKEEKKEEKKEDKKENKKEEKKEEKKDIIKKEPEEKWEIIQKKKNKSNKEREIEDENNEIIGLNSKNLKEGKKGKKKKKQFEDVDFELGFKVK